MSKSISQWTCTKSGGDSTRVIWKRSFKDGPKLEENEPITTKKSFSIQSPIRFLFRKLFFLSNRQILQGFSRVLCRIIFCDFIKSVLGSCDLPLSVTSNQFSFHKEHNFLKWEHVSAVGNNFRIRKQIL